ncbi:MAG TPA: hypothetical protein VF392_05545 [Terracidiphilus sp.]
MSPHPSPIPAHAPQESGCSAAAPRATIVPMRIVLLVLSLSLFVVAVAAMPLPAEQPPSRTTVIVAADHPLAEAQWSSLQSEFRADLPSALAESAAIDPAPQILRGDQIADGNVVYQVLSVRLQGDCTPRINPWRVFTPAVLGWVVRREGRVEPFIFVDCNALVRMLGPAFLGLNPQQQHTLLNHAIAHVMLHEWVHIANQSARHRGKGIEQAQFTLRDLVADPYARSVARLQPPPTSPAAE